MKIGSLEPAADRHVVEAGERLRKGGARGGLFRCHGAAWRSVPQGCGTRFELAPLNDTALE
jgi:hypothetical protein